MNAVKKLRAQLGISQRDMAALLGISKQQLSLYELGLRSMPTASFLKMNMLYAALDSTASITDVTVADTLQRLQQTAHDKMQQQLAAIALDIMALQRQVTDMQLAYAQAGSKLKVVTAVLQQPTTLQDRMFQLSLEIVRDEALKKAKASHPLVQSELQIQLAVLQLQQTLLQQQLAALKPEV
jgi:transcriptional regulator with XRE-family HTH domain